MNYLVDWSKVRLSAYGPADAIVSQNSHHLLSHLNPDWFYLSGTGLPKVVLEKRLLNGCSVVVVLGFVT